MRVNNIASYAMSTKNNGLAKANSMSNSELSNTDMNFGKNIKADKAQGKAALKVLGTIGKVLLGVVFGVFSVIGSLLPGGDSEHDKKIKTGINDKDTCDYKGTSAGDLYHFYSK